MAANPVAATNSAAASSASSWSSPSSGISQNAVRNVPTIEPAVEIENSRPAVRPTVVTDRASSRTTIGVTPARITLAGPKRITAATSGSARGPGSQRTTKSRTGPSSSGTASTAAPPSSSTTTTSAGRGERSASAPPSQ
jgi:hypothetical protein